MSAQPLNTEISIYRTVRTQRQDIKHGNIEAITKRLNPLITVVPGNEVLSGVLTRDTSMKDFSPYCGQAAAGATRGFPIVIGLKDTISFKNAQENLADVDFAFQIGRDKMFRTTTAGLDGDMFADARTLVAANN